MNFFPRISELKQILHFVSPPKFRNLCLLLLIFLINGSYLCSTLDYEEFLSSLRVYLLSVGGMGSILPIASAFRGKQLTEDQLLKY